MNLLLLVIIYKIDNDFCIDNSLILGNNCFTNTV